MATPAEILADSLTVASEAAQDNIIRSDNLPRAHRERLLRSGWLTPVVRGWYILGQPGGQGESAHWYASCWAFISQYLHSRFGEDYCLSADSSIDLHLDQNALPAQLVVMTGSGGAGRVGLPHNASLLTYKVADLPQEREVVRGVQAMPLATALCRCSPALFSREPVKAEIALRMVDVADLNRVLLGGGRTGIAARLIGAYRFLGDAVAATEIEQSMAAAGYRPRPENPFPADDARRPAFGEAPLRITSPYAARIRASWAEMRGAVIDVFPEAPGGGADPIAIFREMKRLYQLDAYHSLSIEGYEVTPELIMRVRSGEWDPDGIHSDAEQRNAMAAKGYANAFDEVCISLRRIFDGSAAADTVRQDFHGWYQALFSPGVDAGIIQAADLVGYRDDQVYLRGSAHVPPPKTALLDAMDAYFDCLAAEPSPSAAAILGHFFFGFIHPYMDGNGRLARFLMNALLVSAGYRWTIVRSEKPRRDRYMQSLERASIKGDIRPFAEFIAGEMAVEWELPGLAG